ncbi:hypothetical protein BO78DRAFT_416376 [Aspergillus sclerotiicarbonarius CBS 121057]|uniref:Uncharacterized protein n=1 Tax=Aspergillus sclerotiicarbonarius (strain CBS 121057 / IBT 28362) TaxID=1448318 RepID=A0A319EPP6_ASPSB|nr:hypothetical protein BO78DRAFT_416376 [Aspergillus sclerotiicarbonarius CBS 121057]
MTLYWYRQRRVRGAPSELVIVLPGSPSRPTFFLSTLQIEQLARRYPNLHHLKRIVLTPLITILKSPSTMQASNMEFLQTFASQASTTVQVCVDPMHISAKGFMQLSVQTNIEIPMQPSVEAFTQTSAIHPSIHPSTIHPSMQPSGIQVPNIQPAIAATQPSTRTYPILSFFQRLSKWSSEQLDALNISQHDMVTPSVLIGEEYIPTNRDRVYINLLRAFTGPSEYDIAEYDPTSDVMKSNPLESIFQHLSMVFDIEYKGERVPSTADILIKQLGVRFDLFKDNFIIEQKNIPFHLRKFNVRGALHSHGGIYHLSDEKRNFPLVVFAPTPEKRHLHHPRPRPHELASLLLPMSTEYNHGKQRPKYTSFCISAVGTEYRITRADASHTYFEDLRHGRPTTEKLLVLRTDVYNLLFGEHRRAFFEAFWAMCVFLVGYWGEFGV